jgi:hypothetical protein
MAGSQFVIDKWHDDKWHDLVGGPTSAEAITVRILPNSYRIELKGETIRTVTQGLNPESQSGKEEK